MAADIGAKIGLSGESAFKSSLTAINAQLKSMRSEMQATMSGFAGMEKSEAALTAKGSVLQNSIAKSAEKLQLLHGESERAKAKLADLGGALEKARAEFGANSAEAIKAENAYNRQVTTVANLENQIHKTNAEMNKMTAELNNVQSELTETGNEAEKTGNRFEGFGSKVAGVLGGIGKAAAVGMAAAVAAVGAIGKQSISAFAEFEQLKGGIETMFGTGGLSIEEYAQKTKKSVDEVRGEYAAMEAAQQTALDNANKAFKTSGLSANEYMETVIGFSAALKNSVGGNAEEAARLADMAIIDMSDNANKLGTDIEMIKNAYRGFARGNFTMLDNLALGFAGTKEGMQQLLDKAKEISGFEYDINSYADIVQAIHVVQEEYGITGTTAKEAAETIQGSLNMVKASWANLISGMAQEDADIERLLEDLTSSIGTFAGNLLPRIEQFLTGFGAVIEKAAPILAEKIPQVAERVLPSITATAFSLVTSFATAIMGALPALVPAAVGAITTIVDGLSANIPAIIPMAVAAVETMASTLTANAPTLIDSAIKLVETLAAGLADNLPQIIAAAVGLVTGLVTTLIDHAPQILAAGAKLIGALIQGIIGSIPALVQSAAQLNQKFLEFWASVPDMMLEIGKNIIGGLWRGIKQAFDPLISGAKGMVDRLKGVFTGKQGFDIHSPSRWAKQIGGYIMQGLGIGMRDDTTAVAAAKKATVKIGETIKNEIEKSNAALLEIQKAGNKEQEKALKERVSALQKFQQEYEKSVADIEQKQSTLAGKLADYGKLFERVKEEETEKELFKLGDLDAEIRKIQQYGEAVAKAKEMGLSDGLLAEVSKMSVDDATDFLNELTKSTAKFDEFVRKFEEKQELAKEVAGQFYSEEAAALENEYLSKMRTAFSELGVEAAETIEQQAGEFETMGELMMSGVESGIESGKSGVINAIRRALSEAVSAGNDELDIHSPSRKFKEMGVQSMAGYAAGVKDRIKSAADMVRNSMSVVSSPVPAMAGGGYSRNYTYGDIVLNVANVNNANDRDVRRIATELEFIRRQQSDGKGGGW